MSAEITHLGLLFFSHLEQVLSGLGVHVLHSVLDQAQQICAGKSTVIQAGDQEARDTVTSA